MEPVSMNDGLEGRDPLAFGLGAAEVAVFVLCLLSAYALLRSGLPGTVAWAGAAIVAGAGAVLSWGRWEGLSLVQWAVLLMQFLGRTRVVPRTAGLVRAARAMPSHHRADHAPTRHEPARVLSLPLRRQGTAAPPLRGGMPSLVAFFSLNGGSGRTTLAVEVACLLAVHRAASPPARSGGRRVVLLDLCRRSPTVALRLGLPPPPRRRAGTQGSPLLVHTSGLLVGPAPSARPAPGRSPLVGMMAAAGQAGADLVILDLDADGASDDVLRQCDLVVVTLTPTAGGVLDAYRSTAALRRLGLRDRLAHVVNRATPGVDLGVVVGDLGVSILAEIPEDRSLVVAENGHSLVGLDGSGPAAAALRDLATLIDVRVSQGQASRTTAGLHAG